MIIIKPERLVQSKTPGVSYVVKTVTHAQRLDLEIEVSEKNEDAQKLADSLRAGLLGKHENSTEVLRALEKVKVAENKVRIPTILKSLLVRVEGLSLDGEQPMTVEQFVQHAPSILVEEAYSACLGTFGLTEEQQKN